MTRHASVWLDDPAPSSGPWEPVVGDHQADVVVVGAGITGLTTALLAARDGHRVVVLEGRRVGAGTSGHTTGKVTSQHGLLYARLTDWAGEERARQYADANGAGVELVARLVDELSIDCDLTRADAFAYVRTPGPVHDVEREAEAAARLGLPASLVHDCGLPFPVEAAVRFEDQLHVHPGRYLEGLARAVVAAGGAIHEQSRVTRVSEAHGRVVAETPSGSVEGAHAVVATLLPPGILGGYFARTRPQLSYGLALRLGADAPGGLTISVDHPVWSTRPWPGGGPNGLIVVGSGHEVGAPVDTEDHYDGLEAWARRTFDVEEVTHRWCAHDYVTPDRVPYVGRLPLYERVQVATGFGKWGLSNGSAAALILTDAIAGRVSPWHEVFDAARIDGVRAVPDLLLGNAKVGAELVVGELRRDAPRCTHLGCRLRWNGAEETWDCHCHGSRFDADGSVRAGPAVQPLSGSTKGATNRPSDGPISGHSTG